MLRLSKKIDYGLILLRDMCAEQDATSAREIAARYRLPPSMIANILKAFAVSGILRSTRGARGGYEMARDPRRVSLAEIVESLEGPFSLVDCVEDDSCCQFASICPTHDPMQAVHQRFYQFMSEFSLAEILGAPFSPNPLEAISDEIPYLPR